MASSEDSLRNVAPVGAGAGIPGAGAANPAALTVQQLAQLLGLAEEKVRRHVVDGVPTAPDGSINLVKYVAWLNHRLKLTDGG